MLDENPKGQHTMKILCIWDRRITRQPHLFDEFSRFTAVYFDWSLIFCYSMRDVVDSKHFLP